MNKTKHEAQHVLEYSAELETNRLRLCIRGSSMHMERVLQETPKKSCLSQ